MKKISVIFLLMQMSIAASAQLADTSIKVESEAINVIYLAPTLISKTVLTFLEFKTGEYGIQLLFITPNKISPSYLNNRIDNVVFNLTNDKRLILERPYYDTTYDTTNNKISGNLCWQTRYIIDESQFRLLKEEKVLEIISNHVSEAVLLRLRKKSQKEIYNTANLF